MKKDFYVFLGIIAVFGVLSHDGGTVDVYIIKNIKTNPKKYQHSA